MTDQTPSDGGFDATDPIAAAWADQNTTDGAPNLPADPAALVDSLNKAHRKDQRRLFWLNVREVLPSFVVAGIFLNEAPNSEHPAALQAAAGLIIAVGCFLAGSSIRQQRADRSWGSSVRDQLARRLAQVSYGARLLRNVGWWYFLPYAVAIALAAYGFGYQFQSTSDLIFPAVTIVFFAVMYPINRRIGRTRYESEVERLEPLLAEFDRTVS